MPRRRRREPDARHGFAGFTEVEEIGAGAFASVYRAREEDTNRQVALKLLRFTDARPAALETFHRETLAHGSVSSHPHILTLYRTFTHDDGRPVLVLELCQGSLAERVRRDGALTSEQAVAVGIKIAGALETAHRADLLHRDVKPQNVFETSYGEPVLADFGIAQLQSASQGVEGVFGFTTLHAPPELLEGGQVTPATDVYELASTLYQLVSGRAAFAAFADEAPASVILRILRDPVTPLLGDGIPIELSDLLVRAMSKDPEARPASALELARALQDIQARHGWPIVNPAVIGVPAPDLPAPDLPAPAPAVPDPPVPEPSPAVEEVPPIAARARDVPPDPFPGVIPLWPSGPGQVVPTAAARHVIDPRAPGAPPAPGPVVPAASVPSDAPSEPDRRTRVGPEFVTPADTTSRPGVDRPFEHTMPTLGATGSFAPPAEIAAPSAGRAGWVLPVVVVTAFLAALVLLLVVR